jgi:D-alanyl-D-alanine dipeptidase
MDAAAAFMQAATDHPVEECREPVARLDTAIQAAGVDIALSSRPHANGGPRLHVLRASIIDDLLAVGDTLNARGWRLVVEDALRTRDMQRRLAQSPGVIDRLAERTSWEVGGGVPPFDLLVRRLGVLVAPNCKVGTHLSASAVDVSVVDRRTGAEIERGGRYLEISERTPMTSPFISAEERAVRDVVTACMAERGYVAYPFEFWHYCKGDVFERLAEGSQVPARYGAVDVDLETNSVTPIARPSEPLSDPADLDRLMSRALERYAVHPSLGADATSS